MAKHRRRIGTKVKLGLAAAGITAAALLGVKAAEKVATKGPKSLRPPAEKVVKTAKEAKKEVDSMVKKLGWMIVWRGLGAACGAATTASLIGGKRRRYSTSGGGRSVLEESSTPGVGGKVKTGIVATGTIGGAIFPAPAMTAAALTGIYRLWRRMSPEQRADAIDAMGRPFRRRR